MKRQVIIDPKILAGKPVIEGTRIPVSLIVNLFAHGHNINQVIEDYPILTKQDVETAREYI